MLHILNWILIAAAVPLILWLVVRATRRSKELSERIERYHAEQEAAKQQSGGLDPYREFAALFGAGDDESEVNRMPAEPDSPRAAPQ